MLYTINANNHIRKPNGAIVVDDSTQKVIGFAPCFHTMRGLHINQVKSICDIFHWEIREYYPPVKEEHRGVNTRNNVE